MTLRISNPSACVKTSYSTQFSNYHALVKSQNGRFSASTDTAQLGSYPGPEPTGKLRAAQASIGCRRPRKAPRTVTFCHSKYPLVVTYRRSKFRNSQLWLEFKHIHLPRSRQQIYLYSFVLQDAIDTNRATYSGRFRCSHFYTPTGEIGSLRNWLRVCI